MSFREEMPDVAHIHCPRCGDPCVEIPLSWTVSVEEGYDDLLIKTTVTTKPVRHECPRSTP